MNERIRELAKQADIKLDYFGYGVDIDGGNPNVSKFAELIVRECAKAAGGVHGYRDILEHFGLKR